MLIDVNQILLSKPKKSDTTYFCNCYYQEKKSPLHITLDNVYIISTNKNTVYVKGAKVVYDMLSSISNKIITIVKDNRASWFTTSMPDELIDDYYSHPIIYDEKYGDLIRLKLGSSSPEGGLNYPLKKRSNVKLTLMGIRIFKQKFTPEWSLDEVIEEEGDVIYDDMDEELEDIDIPYEDIRREYLRTIDDMIDSLSEHLKKTQVFKEDLEKADFKTMIGICDRIDEFLAKSGADE